MLIHRNAKLTKLHSRAANLAVSADSVLLCVHCDHQHWAEVHPLQELVKCTIIKAGFAMCKTGRS